MHKPWLVNPVDLRNGPWGGSSTGCLRHHVLSQLTNSAPQYHPALFRGMGQASALLTLRQPGAVDVHVFRQHTVPASVKFPSSNELRNVINELEQRCGLPYVGAAIDGTFMKIVKPEVYGDTYWCCKRCPAILILGCCVARGVFTYASAGDPGSLGDAFAWNHSNLLENILSGEWMSLEAAMTIEDFEIQPYVVADSGFGLSTRVMTCYDKLEGSEQHKFNYAVICSLC